MKKDFIDRFVVISIFWLFFFFAPFLLLSFPPVSIDAYWFYVYFVFALPFLFLVVYFIEVFKFNKKNIWLKELFKYFTVFFISYVILVIWFFLNVKIGISL